MRNNQCSRYRLYDRAMVKGSSSSSCSLSIAEGAGIVFPHCLIVVFKRLMIVLVRKKPNSKFEKKINIKGDDEVD